MNAHAAEQVRIPGTNVAVTQKAPLAAGGAVTAFVPQTLDEVWRFSEIVSAGGFAPPGLRSPQAVMVAIMHGAEVGLTPFAAIKNIAVINNRPTIWGDGCVGIVRASGLCEYIKETISGAENDWTATCAVKRKGEPEEVRTFSVADAKRAGVWGKSGPWTQYPKRMLGIRARSFALRDVFPDVLGGLVIREEVEDSTDMIDVTPPPAPPAEEEESSAATAPAIQRKPRAARKASAAPPAAEPEGQQSDAADAAVASDAPPAPIEDATYSEVPPAADEPAPDHVDPETGEIRSEDEVWEDYTKSLAADQTEADIGATWDRFEGEIKGNGPGFTAKCSDAYLKRRDAIRGETPEQRRARLKPAYDDGVASFYNGRKRTLGVPKAFKDGGELEKTWWKGYENADQGREPNPAAAAPPPADDTFPGDKPPAADAPPAAPSEAAIDAAYEMGRQAKIKGMSSRALPGEFRAEGREDEALAWRQGYDDASKG